MGEYEDRYPDAYGHGELREDQAAEPQPASRPHPWPASRPLVVRTPQEIRDDVADQLAGSPSIDAAGISVTVDGSEVALDGTANSLIEISMAQALVSNIPGVSRVQVRLRIQHVPRRYESMLADTER